MTPQVIFICLPERTMNSITYLKKHTADNQDKSYYFK